MNRTRIKRTAALFACLTLLHTAGMAQEEGARDAGQTSQLLWILCIFIASLILFLVYIFRSFQTTGKKAMEPASLAQWWASLDKQIFTRAIPVEKEADHLLDHDYDGIRELDNSLPPWWKYGFYFTIAIAVIYVLRFHVWNTGLNPEQEYSQEMQIAAAQVEAYRKQAGELVDEKTVTMADAAGITAGKQIYQSGCIACHGANGEGGIGPNLTDAYWLHGGSINNVFKTIKYGVPEKGMQAWEKTYSPSQIKNIASYVKSLAGTSPANAKAPQGELEAAATAAGNPAPTANR